MRALISYDDISLPQAREDLRPHVSFDNPPPSKRRRRSSHKASQHWDDPGCSDETMNYDEDAADGCVDTPADIALDDEADQELEESRDLTYDEIWDDSALINAWDAAMEEYEVSCCPNRMVQILITDGNWLGLSRRRETLEKGANQ